MMGAVELLALSLGLSVVVAAASLAGGTLIERMSADPRLRDRAWGAALMLPMMPPLATALLLMTPPPVREVAMTMAPPLTNGPALTAAARAPVEAAALTLDTRWIALAVLALAGALVLTRLILLARRARRLSTLLRTGGTADSHTLGLVQDAARHLAIHAPVVMMSAATAEPLLAGLRPARLVLPQDLPATDTVRRAVILHELAHLKRGDHRALWLEEAVLALLAANPLMPLLRARRAAAREEACDAVALAGAGIETRRAYAQSLIEALRTRAGSQTAGAMPALTFTGAGRTTAMHRLKAVLNPAAPANRRARMSALVTGVALMTAVAAGTAAVAAQRAPALRTATTPAQAETAEVLVWMPVELEGRAVLAQGDLVHIALTDASGTLLAESLSTGEHPNGLRIPLTRAQFPGLGQGNRAYTLTGEIRRADGSVERAAEPVTVRLGAGSERTARNLRASLVFQPMPGAAKISPSATRPADIAALRFDVTAASPILAKDGDVLKVWIDGPFESGARTTRMLTVPLAGGPFQPVSTQVDVAAPAQDQGADFIYRAEIVDRDGRKTHETHSPALITVRGRSAVATPRLMPVG